MKEKAQLIVALDVETLAEVRELVEALKADVDIFKVGSQLFTACGPAAVRFIMAQGKKVFLDLKYHDIPNTVANSVRAVISLSQAVERTAQGSPKSDLNKSGVFMYTVHTLGGEEMMIQAATAGAKQAETLGVTKPLCVGVTVLTSEAKKDNILDLVIERATRAKQAGLSGVIASVDEAAEIRKKFGDDFIIVTPGIRPKGSDVGDQKRVATPAQAIKNGSNFLVVGRPIVKADDPLKATKEILEEIDKA